MVAKSPDKSHDADVARLHAQGQGRNDISRELGIASGSVTNIAKRLGLRFDGSQVLMATEVRRREAAERRAVLSIRLLEKAEALLDRMDQKMTYVQYGGKDFDRKEDTYDLPIPQDQAHLARAATALIERATRLDEYDRIGSTLADAFSFLGEASLTIISGAAQYQADQAQRALEAGDASTQPQASG